MKTRGFDGMLHGLAALPILLAMGATYFFGIRPQHQAALRLAEAESLLQEWMIDIREVRHRQEDLNREVAEAEVRVTSKRRSERTAILSPQQLLDHLSGPIDGEVLELGEFRSVEPTSAPGFLTSIARLEGSYTGCCSALSRLHDSATRPLVHSVTMNYLDRDRVSMEVTFLSRDKSRSAGDAR